MKLPEKLVTIASDYDGKYSESGDCAIARALKREGFKHGFHEDMFSVSSFGHVLIEGRNHAIYLMPDGSKFYSDRFYEAKETGNYPVLVLQTD